MNYAELCFGHLIVPSKSYPGENRYIGSKRATLYELYTTYFPFLPLSPKLRI